MVTRIQNLLKDRKLDAMLITSPENMRYISGFRGGEGILYLSANRQVLITDSRYTEQAQKETAFEVKEENAAHPRNELLKECIGADTAKTIGYEDQSMRCSEFAGYEKALGVENWQPLENSVNRLRIVKSGSEITLLRKAEEIGDIAFSKILDFLKPGVTELQVAAELEYQMKKAGAQKTSFDTIIASGLHSSMPHAIPTDKKLEVGDFVTMDFGCCVDGYCSDMTRTVVIGKASDRQKEIYNTVLEAQEAALLAVRAGITGAEVDKIARDIIAAKGYGECFGHGLGHSVGLLIHEEPRLSPKGTEILEENVSMTVEPGIYVPGFGGVRIEDMVIIKKDGCENLTHSPKHLIEL